MPRTCKSFDKIWQWAKGCNITGEAVELMGALDIEAV